MIIINNNSAIIIERKTSPKHKAYLLKYVIN